MADESQLSDLDLDNLFSHETLDRSSPELFPETIPGVTDFIAKNVTATQEIEENIPNEWSGELDQEDIRVFHGFSSLSQSALIDKVKEMQNLAYQLGLEESHEMTRGKFLSILESSTSLKATDNDTHDDDVKDLQSLDNSFDPSNTLSIEAPLNGNADKL